MRQVFILDSYCLMASFHDEPSADYLESLIRKARQQECQLKLSLVNWGDIYYSICRSHHEKAAKEFLLFIEDLPIELIDINRDLVFEAAQLKSKYRIAYADCFAAALAKREDAPVITGDQEFKALAREIKIHWI